MKKYNKKNKGVVKGAPSAFVISILVHVGAFLLAGMLVVFTVAKKEEKQFVPPKPVERPKMKLKKPKVKIKKSSKPKPTTRIVTKMNKASMPDIQLPEMTGLGDGIGGFEGGIDLTIDFSKVASPFGNPESDGTDFEGTLYAPRYRRGGGQNAMMEEGKFVKLMYDFLDSGWKTSVFSRYYRSKKLYTPTLFIPPINSFQGPEAFGEPQVAGDLYALHYKGTIVHPKGGRFRLWIMGDNFMVVRLDDEIIADFSNLGSAGSKEGYVALSKKTPYHLGHWPAYKGRWFDLEPGVPRNMEFLFGEFGGGAFAAMTVIEQEGVEYPKNREGGPMLPILKTTPLSRDQSDAIYEYLYEDHYAVTNGPVFNDYTDDHEDYNPDYRAAYDD